MGRLSAVVPPSGMIFSIGMDGNGYQVLYNFVNSSNGGGAYGDLTLGKPKFYGMTLGKHWLWSNLRDKPGWNRVPGSVRLQVWYR